MRSNSGERMRPASAPRTQSRSAIDLFQRFNLLFQERRHAMSRKIHLANTDSQSFGNFLRRPFFAHVTIENLKLFWIDFLLHARDRSVQQVFLPFPFPERVK